MATINHKVDLSAIRRMVEEVIETQFEGLEFRKVDVIKDHLLREIADDVIHSPGEHWGWDDASKSQVAQDVDVEYMERLIRDEVAKLLSNTWKVAVRNGYFDEYELTALYPDVATALLVGMDRCSKSFTEIVELDGGKVSDTDIIDPEKSPTTFRVYYISSEDPDGPGSQEYTIFL